MIALIHLHIYFLNIAYSLTHEITKNMRFAMHIPYMHIQCRDEMIQLGSFNFSFMIDPADWIDCLMPPLALSALRPFCGYGRSRDPTSPWRSQSSVSYRLILPPAHLRQFAVSRNPLSELRLTGRRENSSI